MAWSFVYFVSNLSDGFKEENHCRPDYEYRNSGDVKGMKTKYDNSDIHIIDVISPIMHMRIIQLLTLILVSWTCPMVGNYCA